MSVLPICMYICIPFAYLVPVEGRRLSSSKSLELYILVSHRGVLGPRPQPSARALDL